MAIFDTDAIATNYLEDSDEFQQGMGEGGGFEDLIESLVGEDEPEDIPIEGYTAETSAAAPTSLGYESKIPVEQDKYGAASPGPRRNPVFDEAHVFDEGQSPIAPTAPPGPRPGPSEQTPGLSTMPGPRTAPTGAGMVQQSASRAAPTQSFAGVGAPPPAKGRDDTMAMIAAAMDLFLNRGRNMGQIFGSMIQPDDSAYETWKRNAEAAKLNQGLAPKSQGMSPYQQESLQLRRDKMNQPPRGPSLMESLALRRDAREEAAAGRRPGWKEKKTFETNEDIRKRTAFRKLTRRGGGGGGRSRNLGQVAEVDAAVARKVYGAEEVDPLMQAAVAGNKEAAKRLSTMAGEARKHGLKGKNAGLSVAQQKQQVNLSNESNVLRGMEAKLAARPDQDAMLPSRRGGAIGQGLRGAESWVTGGSGMSAEDTSIELDLTNAGLSTYISVANNAPNSLPEQKVANAYYRGDGTIKGSLARIRKRMAEIKQQQTGLQPDTAQPAPQPVAATPQGGGGKTYSITSPSGKTKERELTAQQAELLRSKGFKVE